MAEMECSTCRHRNKSPNEPPCNDCSEMFHTIHYEPIDSDTKRIKKVSRTDTDPCLQQDDALIASDNKHRKRST